MIPYLDYRLCFSLPRGREFWHILCDICYVRTACLRRAWWFASSATFDVTIEPYISSLTSNTAKEEGNKVKAMMTSTNARAIFTPDHASASVAGAATGTPGNVMSTRMVLLNSQNHLQAVAPRTVVRQIILHRKSPPSSNEKNILGRKEILKMLGFGNDYINNIWMKKFHLLTTTQKAYGHIPRPLKYWVNIQRQHKDQLNDYKMRLLDEVGVFCDEKKDTSHHEDTKDNASASSEDTFSSKKYCRVPTCRSWRRRHGLCVRHGARQGDASKAFYPNIGV